MNARVSHRPHSPRAAAALALFVLGLALGLGAGTASAASKSARSAAGRRAASHFSFASTDGCRNTAPVRPPALMRSLRYAAPAEGCR